MIIKYKTFINEKSNIIISLADLEQVIKSVFDDSKVSSVNTTYEKDDDGFKFIITMNNIFYEKTNIIHNKIIFYTDEKKRKLTKNHFLYLYDINCKFRQINFINIEELQNSLKDVFTNRKFGKNIKILSDIYITFVNNINKWLSENDIDNISIYNINYNPIVDVIPCESLFFKFNINIDDTRFIDMTIRKIEEGFKITFNENEWFKDIEISDLEALTQTVGEMIKNHIG